MKAPADLNNPAGPKLRLQMVKPVMERANAITPVTNMFGDISECNTFINNVLGEMRERVAVFGGLGHEALADEEKEPTQAIATFVADQPTKSGAGLATELTKSRTTKGPHDKPLPNRYTGMANKDASDAALGMDKGAKAKVGEGYVITQGSPMPGDVTVRAWLDALEKKLYPLAHTAAETDVFKHKWGYHYGGIVAEVGDDSISLENYNRGTPFGVCLRPHVPTEDRGDVLFRQHLETLAGQGKTIPSIPVERNKWLKKLMTDITKLDDTATAEQAATATAVQQVFDAAKKMEVPPISSGTSRCTGAAPVSRSTSSGSRRRSTTR